MPERLTLSMKELAHMLGVSPAFLYNEINRGKLKTIKFGKRRLILREDVDAYIAAHRQLP